MATATILEADGVTEAEVELPPSASDVLDAFDSLKTSTDQLHTDLTAPLTAFDIDPLSATTDLTPVFDSSSASGERTLITAGVGAVTIRGHRMIISAAGATTVELRDGAGGAVLKTFEFPDKGAYPLDFSARPYFKGGAAKALVRYSSAAVKVTVDLEYVKN